MNYFVKKGNVIEKANVLYESEQLEKIRLEIINNCSEIEHCEYDDIVGPNRSDSLRIRNYSAEVIGTRELNDFYATDLDLYHYSYDKYNYPCLVYLIDRLLSGDGQAMFLISNPSLNHELPTVSERIQQLSNDLDVMDDSDVKSKKAKIIELEKLLKLEKYNKNQQSVMDYYSKVQSLITLEFVDLITMDEILRYTSFFNQTNEVPKIIAEQHVKVMKK